MLSQRLLTIARHPLVGSVVGMAFQYVDFLLPVRRVGSTSRVVAFGHPKPSWKLHILLVPKSRIPTLLAMATPPHDDFYVDILLMAGCVEQRLGLVGDDYVLCANGGPRQEVQQVHFHMFRGEQYVSSPIFTPVETLYEDPEVVAFNHPAPTWDVHLVLRLKSERTSFGSEGPDPRPLGRVTAILVKDLQLDKRGYTLVINHCPGSYRRGDEFHVIAGRRRTT
jgi:histidine triad (HIT) family protein